MALRMVKLVRDPKSGSWKSRKVIPADVRDAYGRANETPTWPASLSAPQAKAAWSAWLSEVEARIDRLRRITLAKPVSLSHREVHALAGKWYAEQVQAHEDDPGDLAGWEAARDEIVPDDEDAAYAAHLNGERYEGPIRRIPRLGRQAQDLLEREGVVLDGRTAHALLDQLHELYGPLCDLMVRRARGDYGADPKAATLPTWSSLATGPTRPAPSLSLMGLFDSYVAERKPAAATEKAWRRQLAHLKAFLGHDDALRVTGADLVGWKDALLAPKPDGTQRSARTVKDTYLAAAKTTFGYAVDNKLLPSNPALGITARGPKKTRLRDPGFTDVEAKTILRATLLPISGFTPERTLAVRWVPWLCAYTGARVGEMTQLRKQDVFQSEGVWVVRITPEAGSTKTGEARVVPLHEDLISQGFAAMVEKAKAGPLFYDPQLYRGGLLGNPQSKKAGEAIARWVRGLGVTDPEILPSHGWRHRFETEMRKASLDYEARHVIVGHAFKTESGTYGRWTASALKREIDKLPTIDMAH